MAVITPTPRIGKTTELAMPARPAAKTRKAKPRKPTKPMPATRAMAPGLINR